MRKRRILPVFSALFVAGASVHLAGMVVARDARAAPAEHPLIAGCTDIPEAVALSEHLALRADRVQRHLHEMEARRAELAEAEAALTARLSELRAATPSAAARQGAQTAAVEEDIRRMIALYDAMKPADAAQVMSNLPPDYAAEILMRLAPENGARVVAALEPGTAAILTTYMGARSARRP